MGKSNTAIVPLTRPVGTTMDKKNLTLVSKALRLHVYGSSLYPQSPRSAQMHIPL